MPNKSKAKGNAFERELVEILSRVFELNFQRVPNSGSFTGGKNAFRYDKMTDAQKLLHDGDIIVPEELSHISIECKNYKEFAFHSLFTGKGAIIDEWIKQSDHTNKPNWLLFFKITRKNTYVCHSIGYNLKISNNTMIYQGKYYIELAEPFLIANKDNLLKMKTYDDIKTDLIEL